MHARSRFAAQPVPSAAAAPVKQANANLVLKVCGVRMWSSGTYRSSIGARPYCLVLDNSGSLLLLDGRGERLWQPRTSDAGTSPRRLVLSDSGTLALLDAANTTLWQLRPKRAAGL